jgi:transcriptional regulator with XRE-family HTH domain
MAADCVITNRLRRKQTTMFREAERQFGLTQKSIHLETGMSVTSLSEYARGLTSMSGEAIMKLAEWRDFPAELLTMLFAGTGREVRDEGDDPEEAAIHELGREGAHFLAEKADAEADGVVNLDEKRKLKRRARRIEAAARKVAAA